MGTVDGYHYQTNGTLSERDARGSVSKRDPITTAMASVVVSTTHTPPHHNPADHTTGKRSFSNEVWQQYKQVAMAKRIRPKIPLPLLLSTPEATHEINGYPSVRKEETLPLRPRPVPWLCFFHAPPPSPPPPPPTRQHKHHPPKT